MGGGGVFSKRKTLCFLGLHVKWTTFKLYNLLNCFFLGLYIIVVYMLLI